jgi:hypothetical protein
MEAQGKKMTLAEQKELEGLTEQLLKLIETACRLSSKSERRTAFREISCYRDRLNQFAANRLATGFK